MNHKLSGHTHSPFLIGTPLITDVTLYIFSVKFYPTID